MCGSKLTGAKILNITRLWFAIGKCGFIFRIKKKLHGFLCKIMYRFVNIFLELRNQTISNRIRKPKFEPNYINKHGTYVFETEPING